MNWTDYVPTSDITDGRNYYRPNDWRQDDPGDDAAWELVAYFDDCAKARESREAA